MTVDIFVSPEYVVEIAQLPQLLIEESAYVIAGALLEGLYEDRQAGVEGNASDDEVQMIWHEAVRHQHTAVLLECGVELREHDADDVLTVEEPGAP